MINFGIDLGTTNSAIAKFENGKVEIFRNPLNLKQTLPSVVAFRKNRIMVGDKAREYMQRDPNNVVGAFKRKMGTSEAYKIASLEENKTPIQLSAEVLKELKNFVHTGENIEAAVITIPASFDTIQSNATKKAGFEAGFQQVVLLQEPIAASLAYANKEEEAFEEGRWLVYDLGGGTFDVALVQIADGEMKVIDNEGDNFLGGADFDKLIVEELVIPYLKSVGTFDNLEQEMKSASGKYNKLYHVLMHKAEEAKIQLTNTELAEIEFETEDDKGDLVDGYLEITRYDFEKIIKPYIQNSIKKVRSILDRNSLTARNIKFVLMVGGSTYIPFVREQVGAAFGVNVNCNIDPTTAVAIGAAFYAGTRLKQTTENQALSTKEVKSNLKIKVAYQKTSQEDDEFFTALVEGDLSGLSYRIIRKDGGYDSGVKPLKSRIMEQLLLATNTHNFFEFKVTDSKGDSVAINVPMIGITQGKYNVVGQPLPNDICLEIDDFETGQTILEVIFEKNSILPTKRTFVKEITKTIRKGSDDMITINIVEGPGFAMPSANQTIGFISISGKDLTRDLVKGSDVEITLEMSESRDLRINVYLMLTDQEYDNVFMPSERQVNVNRLSEELMILYKKASEELQEAENNENYEAAAGLKQARIDVRKLLTQAKKLTEDDVTDEKFQIDTKKRELAQQVDNLTRDKHIIQVKMEYANAKHLCKSTMEYNEPTPQEQQSFDYIVSQEKTILSSNSRLKINELIDKLYRLRGNILWRSGDHVKGLFYYVVMRKDEYSNEKTGEQYIKAGEEAIENDNMDKLRVCVNTLFNLLPDEEKPRFESGGTGIG
jgi:molecular chaperone DnaK